MSYFYLFQIYSVRLSKPLDHKAIYNPPFYLSCLAYIKQFNYFQFAINRVVYVFVPQGAGNRIGEFQNQNTVKILFENRFNRALNEQR